MQRYRVFLSHASEDRWIAEVIRQKLHEVGVEVWLDVFDLPGGANIKARLRQEMQNSDECLVLFSPVSTFDWSATRSASLTPSVSGRPFFCCMRRRRNCRNRGAT
jgi:hypothetical protein